MKWRALTLLVVYASCEQKPGLSHHPTARDTAWADSVIAAQASHRTADSAQPVAASASADSLNRDSAAFALLADSMDAMDRKIAMLDNDSSAARMLFELGKLKERSITWMLASTPHWDAGVPYAKAHESEFGYFDPDARFYYKGREWQDLLTRFPQSSLADSARWYLAHMQRGHGD